MYLLYNSSWSRVHKTHLKPGSSLIVQISDLKQSVPVCLSSLPNRLLAQRDSSRIANFSPNMPPDTSRSGAASVQNLHIVPKFPFDCPVPLWNPGAALINLQEGFSRGSSQDQKQRLRRRVCSWLQYSGFCNCVAVWPERLTCLRGYTRPGGQVFGDNFTPIGQGDESVCDCYTWWIRRIGNERWECGKWCEDYQARFAHTVIFRLQRPATSNARTGDVQTTREAKYTLWAPIEA